jgi:GxxExxY protein
MDKEPPNLPPSLSPWSKAEISKFYYGALTDRIIAAAIAVHKELGPGFLESIYEEAFALELKRQGLVYLRQVPVRVSYMDVPIGMHRIDLIVEEKIVVELKAVKDIDDAHLATCCLISRPRSYEWVSSLILPRQKHAFAG